MFLDEKYLSVKKKKTSFPETPTPLTEDFAPSYHQDEDDQLYNLAICADDVHKGHLSLAL